MDGFFDRTWEGYLAYWSSTVGRDNIRTLLDIGLGLGPDYTWAQAF